MSFQPETVSPTTPRPERARLGRILVGTDGSSTALEALEFAIDLADQHGSELLVVHVVPLVDVVAAPELDEVDQAVLHAPTAYDHEFLEEAAAIATEHGVHAATALLPGTPAAEIVAYAEAHDVDLVVVGSHGHGAVVGALHGSVARGVMRAAKRSVLVVRPMRVSTTTYADKEQL